MWGVGCRVKGVRCMVQLSLITCLNTSQVVPETRSTEPETQNRSLTTCLNLYITCSDQPVSYPDLFRQIHETQNLSILTCLNNQVVPLSPPVGGENSDKLRGQGLVSQVPYFRKPFPHNLSELALSPSMKNRFCRSSLLRMRVTGNFACQVHRTC